MDAGHIARIAAEMSFFNKLVKAYQDKSCRPPSDPDRVLRNIGLNPTGEREIQYDFIPDVKDFIKEKKLPQLTPITLNSLKELLPRDPIFPGIPFDVFNNDKKPPPPGRRPDRINRCCQGFPWFPR